MLNADELPSWFAYPPEHKFLLEMGIRNLQTWVIVTESRQEKALLSCVMEKVPKRSLVPFAMKTDCDLFACWERDKGNKVVLIDPFIGEGFEDFGSYDDYWQWFRAAIDEMIEYAVDEIEYAQKSSQ